MNNDAQEKKVREQSILGRVYTLLQDSLIYGALMAISKFAVLLLLPIYTAYLSSAQFGVLDTMILTGTVLITIFIMGQDEALGRFFYDNPWEGRNCLISTALFIIFCCSITLMAICFIFSHQIVSLVFGNDAYVYEFKLIIIYAAATAFLNFFRSLAKWTWQKKAFFILNVGPTLLILTLTYVAVAVLDMGIRGAIYAQIIANSVFIILAAFFFKRIIFAASIKSFITPFMKYGVPVMLTTAIGNAMNVIDKSLYIHLIDKQTLGIYTLGFRYALFMSVPLTAFWIAWGPFIFSIYKENNANDTVNTTINLFAALFSIVLLLQFSVAELVIDVIAPAYYSDSIWYAIPLSLSFLFESFSNLTSIGINLAKKTYLNIIALLAGLLCIFILASPLVTLMGTVGIAYAVLGGRILMHILKNLFGYRTHHFRYKLAKPYFVMILAFFLSLCIYLAPLEDIRAIAGFRLVSMAILVAVIWKLFFNDEFREKLLTKLKIRTGKR